MGSGSNVPRQSDRRQPELTARTTAEACGVGLDAGADDSMALAGGVAQLARADEALVGRLVAGKFQIVQLLGSGAMGSVYRAAQVALDKHVALKVLHPGLRSDPSFVRRFHREAKAAAALEHPNSVSILDFGEEPDGLLYIAMEYLDGRDLFQVIQDEWPLSKERIVALMRQVCGAVARAHDMGVVHRDLKPENIMVQSRVSDDGEIEEIVKVCDFGIAHLQRSSEDQSTGSLLVGTPEYMAPEVARGEEPEGRSDLYALGVVLFQMLTKQLPFEGEEPSLIALRHIQDPVPTPHSLVPHVDSFLEDIVLMAMAKQPDDRFATARQMRGALRAALEDREYSAADMSGVLSVLPPAVASSMLDSTRHLPVAAPAPLPEIILPQHEPSSPPPAPVPPVAERPSPRTPLALSVPTADELEPESHTTIARSHPPEPMRASKLPWLMSAAAMLVVGTVVMLLVNRTPRGERVPASTTSATQPVEPTARAAKAAASESLEVETAPVVQAESVLKAAKAAPAPPPSPAIAPKAAATAQSPSKSSRGSAKSSRVAPDDLGTSGSEPPVETAAPEGHEPEHKAPGEDSPSLPAPSAEPKSQEGPSFAPPATEPPAVTPMVDPALPALPPAVDPADPAASNRHDD